MRRRSKALCVPGTGVPCRPGAPGFASACSSTIGEHGRVSVAPARTRIPGAFPICVHRCNLWIGPSQFPSFSVSRCLCPPRQDRRPCQGGCLSPHFPAKLRHSPPILPPFLSFASSVVNTSLVTARHAKIVPPSSPSAGEPPVATGSVARRSGLRALIPLAVCRAKVAKVPGNLPNIANRAHARRPSETAPRPRRPKVANRGVRTLAMLATFAWRARNGSG